MIIKDIPKFINIDEKFKWFKNHKDDLIYEAKGTVKEADSISFSPLPLKDVNTITSKSESTEGNDVIKRRLIINTTNYLDSHNDVHIKNIWKKSIKENKRIKHKQEHGYRFKDIISDKKDLKVFTKDYTWRELGYDADGETEALVFDSTIRKSRNEEMFNEYKNGNVDNHSVGMIYKKLFLAINSEDEDYKEEKQIWDKYYPLIVNKEEADNKNIFWVVAEAVVREGSAVPDGSNPITPTIHNDENKSEEPPKDTPKEEPSEDTLSKENQAYLDALKSFIN